MKTLNNIGRPDFGGQISDWNEFQDETYQFDSWNMNFDDEEEAEESGRTDRNDDSDRDDGDPNRYLG